MRVGKPELITPARAAVMLDGNTSNRAVRLNHVADLVTKIKSGQWQLTHQSIALDRNGRVLDGQHRLMAIVESGIAVPMLIAYDCSPDIFEVIDSGIVRTVADAIGVKSSIASMCNTIIRNITGSDGKSNPEVVKMCIEAYGEQLTRCDMGHKIGVPLSMKAAFALRMADEPDRQEHIYEQLQMCIGRNQAMAPQIWAILQRNLNVRQNGNEIFLRTFYGLSAARENAIKLLPSPFERADDEVLEVHSRCAPMLVVMAKQYQNSYNRDLGAMRRMKRKVHGKHYIDIAA